MVTVLVPSAEPSAPPRAPRMRLELDPTERETLLAAVEIAKATADGDTASALFLAQEAYSAPELSQRLDVLGDRLFRLGLPPTPTPAALPIPKEVPALAAA